MENRQQKDNIVGERIQSLRKERGMSLDALGKELGSPRPTFPTLNAERGSPGVTFWFVWPIFSIQTSTG